MKLMKARGPWIEIFLAFIVLNSLNYLLFPEDPGFLQFVLNPYWLVILLAASRYGFGSGLLAAGLAALHVLMMQFPSWPSRTELETAAETGRLTLPLAFLITGAVLGEIRQKYIREADEREALARDRQRDVVQMKELLENSEKARHILETRIVGETSTVRTLYETAQKFESLSVDKVYEGCLEVLASHVEVRKASLYLLDGDQLVLKAAHGWETGAETEGKIPLEKSLMRLAVQQNRMLTVRDILKERESHEFLEQYSSVLAMVPLRGSDGQPVGVVNIEQMDFLSFNEPTLHLVQLVVEWVDKAIQKVQFLGGLSRQLLRDEEMGVYNYSFFGRLLTEEMKRAKASDTRCGVALLKLDRFGFLNSGIQRLLSRTLVTLLEKQLSPYEKIFHFRFEGTFAVLAPLREAASLTALLKETSERIEEFAAAGGTKSRLIFSNGVVSGTEDLRAFLEPLLKECRIPAF